ncbi:MAG TPA: hypothetical protein VD866_12350 [Urbifossiella sp.]|nr:hypothetical protein [Urbifossiella sp.]
MRVEAADIERTFGGEPARFEDFVHALIHEEARACGVRASTIDWDPRTNARDGGRDIVIREGDPRGAGHFIPGRPSVWSAKSGADGVSSTTLRREILPPPPKGRGWPDHPSVRAALARGDVYIWCAAHPAGHGVRDEMRAEADRIAARLGVATDQIEFRWQEQLAVAATRLPNVIPVHLPETSARWVGALYLHEWEREAGLTNAWADFGGRADLVSRVACHLLGRELPNVLHVAGLSGIGKTRAVFEACRRDDRLRGVFYLTRHADFTPGLRRAVEATSAVCLVVDETSYAESEQLRAWFSDCVDRVRIVTIGPAARRPGHSAHPDLIVVEEPRTEDEVLSVIRGPGTGLTEPVLQSIAARSAHDLRLALRLVEATVRRPDLRTVPVVDTEDVWGRLMTLFPADIPDAGWFRRCYEALTVAIDVGFGAEYRGELQAIANYFAIPESDLLDCLNVAERCGLGLRAGRFFEATPHALAVGLFQSLFRRRLRDRLREFMEALPERLFRRFQERCQELPDDLREEVADPVGQVFLSWLHEGDVTALAGRGPSRVFQAWAEFDSARGLAWLRRAVEMAAPDQLRGLDGESDGSGGWRGRRQLVWLCHNLSGFADHFAACEAILYRLARYETEPGIGNNGTAVWRSLFWPVLTPTELPFEQRLPTLLRRVRAVSADDLGLVLGAAFATIDPPHLGLGLPPRMVGGRVTPRPWMPASHEQLRTYRVDAARQVLESVAALQEPVRDLARRWIVDHIPRLGYVGAIDAARALFPTTSLPPDLRRELVVKLDRAVGFHRRVNSDGEVPSHLPQLEAWRVELAVGDLATRVQDLTARGYHDLWMEHQSDTPYTALAAEVLASPEAITGLGEWLGSDAAQGAGPFGFTVGRGDTDSRIGGAVRGWLRTDTARPFVLGYLHGAAARTGELPDDWSAAIDAVVEGHPALAVMASVTADRSARGLDRILGAIGRVPPPASRLLRQLAFGGWKERLGADEQGRVLDSLLELRETGDQTAVGVGVELVAYWSLDPPSLDRGLVPVVSRLVALAPTEEVTHDAMYNWHRVLRLLARHEPVWVAEVVIGLLTGSSHPWRHDDGNAEVLAAAARLAPRGVMDAVGAAVLDPSRRPIFLIGVFHGLFEAVGVAEVRRWVDAHGQDALRWVARHLDSPRADSTGGVVIPPVTEWLFTEREHDQEAFLAFLAGRHSGAFFSRGDLLEVTRAAMAPFASHQLRRVREWAEYEVRHARQHLEWLRRDDEEDERL